MRSSRPRAALALPLCRWPTPASGQFCDKSRPLLITNDFSRFAESVIKAAFKGEKNIVEPTYVYLPGIAGGEEIAKATGVDYFSVPVELGVGVLVI